MPGSIKIKMFDLINYFMKIVSRDTYISKNTIEEGVSNSIDRYKRTLNMLEMYDQGKLSKPEVLVRYSSMREYLQDLRANGQSKRSTVSPS